MVIKRHDYKVNNKPAAIVLRYLLGCKLWLVTCEHECIDRWAEAYDSFDWALDVYTTEVKLRSIDFSDYPNKR